MGRRLFNLVTAISLAVCVLAGALWVYSVASPQFNELYVNWVRRDPLPGQGERYRILELQTYEHQRGLPGVYVSYHRMDVLPPSNVAPQRRKAGLNFRLGSPRASPRIEQSRMTRWGFSGYWVQFVYQNGSPFLTTGVAVSDWLLVLLTLPLPVIWAVRRYRRVRPGLCRACGYDLRGSPPGAACPECGGLRPVGPAT